MTVGCRDARAPDVDGAAETPDCLTMDVTRAGAARAGIDTPEDPPPRICAPAAKQAKRVTIAVPAIWTFQFISLPYSTRCPKHPFGCSDLRTPGTNQESTEQGAAMRVISRASHVSKVML